MQLYFVNASSKWIHGFREWFFSWGPGYNPKSASILEKMESSSRFQFSPLFCNNIIQWQITQTKRLLNRYLYVTKPRWVNESFPWILFFEHGKITRLWL